MARKCLFCGNAGNLTKEHALPAWLTNVLPGNGAFNATLEQDGADRSIEFGGSALAITARAVCATCNSGWMSSLEVRAREVMTPLITGNSSELDSQSQELIALWAVKTAAVFTRIGNAAAGVSESHRRWIFQHQEPPPKTHAWLGAYLASDPNFQVAKVHTRPLLMMRPSRPNEVYDGLEWVCALGRLVVRATILPEQIWSENVTLKGTREAPLLRIFPKSAEVVIWPPPVSFTEAGLEALSRSLVGGHKVPETKP